VALGLWHGLTRTIGACAAYTTVSSFLRCKFPLMNKVDAPLTLCEECASASTQFCMLSHCHLPIDFHAFIMLPCSSAICATASGFQGVSSASQMGHCLSSRLGSTGNSVLFRYLPTASTVHCETAEVEQWPSLFCCKSRASLKYRAMWSASLSIVSLGQRGEKIISIPQRAHRIVRVGQE